MDSQERKLTQIHPGVWRLTLGEPEAFTPTSVIGAKPAVAGLEKLPHVDACPVDLDSISAEPTPRGYLVGLPLRSDEQIYGLGLQLLSLNQRGKKKTLRVNSDPSADLGDSHAPVPFYVTTAGYGVFIDTLRYATVHSGAAARTDKAGSEEDKRSSAGFAGSTELYQAQARRPGGRMMIEIPSAQGVDIYFFAGPKMTQAVQRYNLFSGGGCLPPTWGLGVWYRCKGDFRDSQVKAMADRFRETQIPCDVIGLEPGWQSKAYSCSFTWSDKFPHPAELVRDLAGKGFHLNLWTHAFTHPSSPLHGPLSSHSGDHLVWGGLVPDFADPQARKLYAGFFEKEHAGLGVSGYKLDECDNSDFIRSPWSFPEFSRFPSGLDGEQMHSALGTLYAKTIESIYTDSGKSTYGQLRSAGAFAAPIPFVLYSDLYDHSNYIRGVAVSGFSGLLWNPEVRHATSPEDLIRRVQTAMFSTQAVIDAWYIKNPPWEQWNRDANNADQLAEGRGEVTSICRKFFELRMQFLPYIYSAFVDYHRTGLPPFRALVMEDPTDPNLHNVDNAYMMGDRVLVAPVVAGTSEAEIYLPKGQWRDFWTGSLFEGGKKHRIKTPIEQIPLFVKNNCVLPLAHPAQNTSDPAVRQLVVNVYGSGELGAALYEDGGKPGAYESGEFNTVEVGWDKASGAARLERQGSADVPGYQIQGWKHQAD